MFDIDHIDTAAPVARLRLTDRLTVSKNSDDIASGPIARMLAVGASVLGHIHPHDRSLFRRACDWVKESDNRSLTLHLRFGRPPDWQHRVRATLSPDIEGWMTVVLHKDRGGVPGSRIDQCSDNQDRQQPHQPNPLQDALTLQLKAANLRVLVVDDNAVNREVAGAFLRTADIAVVEAANGREALDALAAGRFDLVLLDIHMPVMDGPTTIDAIRNSGADWSAIPVIALTADAMTGDCERFLGMGMNDYLTKPVSRRDLLTRVSSLV